MIFLLLGLYEIKVKLSYLEFSFYSEYPFDQIKKKNLKCKVRGNSKIIHRKIEAPIFAVK